PAKQVLVKFRAALKAAGISGSMPIGLPTSAGSDSTLVGQTPSATVAQLVASTLAPSDNFYAEMLLRGVGARHGGAGTTAAGLAIEKTTLAKLGVTEKLYDGSGLSHSNRVTPTMVVRLLDQMAKRPEAKALRTGMALAGSTGTVAGRMRGTAAAGRCRLKTGTLSNVSALAGYCTTLGRREVTFAVINNTTSVATARTMQDRVASALASWSDPPETTAATTPATTPQPKATTPATSPTGGV
ncbi:MAG: D-alanyl-D-alanine carboxypeptidase, partial [Solirubrobacteraceae bacterium]